MPSFKEVRREGVTDLFFSISAREIEFGPVSFTKATFLALKRAFQAQKTGSILKLLPCISVD